MQTAPPPIHACPVCGTPMEHNGVCPRCRGVEDWSEQIQAVDYVVRRLQDWHALGSLTSRQMQQLTESYARRRQEMVQAQQDGKVAAAATTLNFTSPALLCDALAARFERQGSGVIAVITSVAGDRGRQSNYIYGAAKGGLQHYLEGLRHRLHVAGVQVLDVRPGFVATRMTAHLPQAGPLWAQPDRVARDILRAVETGRAVLYTPWFWRGIMAGVRNLPRPLLHRTRL